MAWPKARRRRWWLHNMCAVMVGGVFLAIHIIVNIIVTKGIIIFSDIIGAILVYCIYQSVLVVINIIAAKDLIVFSGPGRAFGVFHIY